MSFHIRILVNYVVQHVHSSLRENIDLAGKFAVLFYVSGTVYKLCAMQKSEHKEVLKSYIESSVKGHKEVDWYRVDNDSQIEQIVEYSKFSMIRRVNGVVFNMVHG